MKLIIAIVRDQDTDAVAQALIQEGMQLTLIASTGGFLRKGSSTLMIGTDEKMVDEAIRIIRDNTTLPPDQIGKRATLFVLSVAQFTQI